MYNLLQRGWASLETKPHLWLLIIIGLGLGLRLALPASVTGSEGRSRWYRTAANLAEGDGYTLCWPEYFPFCRETDPTAISEPAPVLTYAGLIWLFGDEDEESGPSRSAIIVVQTVLGLAVTLLIYHLALELFENRRAGLLAALLWALYLPLITVERDFLAEAIFIFLLTSGMLAVIRGLKHGQALSWAGAGLLLGLATLSRSALLYFLPLLTVLLLLISRTSLRQRWLNAGLLLLMFSLTLTPWIVRNAQTFGVFVPDNTLKGYNLYRHNHILAGDNYFRYVFIKEMELAVENALQQGIREGRTDVTGDENEYEMDRLYQQEAIKIIRAYPGRYIMLSLYRLWPLLTDYGVRLPLTPIWQLVALENILLVGLAATTVIRRRFRPYTTLPLLALIGLFVAGYMLVNARLRFMVPLMPFIMVLAADQALYWLQRFMPRS